MADASIAIRADWQGCALRAARGALAPRDRRRRGAAEGKRDACETKGSRDEGVKSIFVALG